MTAEHTEADADETLRDKVARAFDPSGETVTSVEAMAALVDDAGARSLLEQAGVNPEDLRAQVAAYRRPGDVAAAAIVTFAPLGWAACNAMPVDGYAEALQVFTQHGAEAAEEVLVEAWPDASLRRPIKQILGLGAGNPTLVDLMRQRARLLIKAHEHHVAGAYEASIPILLAQIEGLVIDVSDGKKFFSGDTKWAANVLDDGAIATLSESLSVVRDLFSTNSRTTVADGGFGRHAILHGRELAYNTKANSTKCFVLLQAVVEWAQPVARATIEQQRADEQDRWAGSTEVDEDGRRRDQREFTATRLALGYLHTSHWRRYETGDRFQADLLPIVESRFVRDGLPVPHGVTMHVSEDGQTWWAWRRTITGWHLGIGATSHTSTWHYDDAEAPTGGPDAVPDQWAEAHSGISSTPNWP